MLNGLPIAAPPIQNNPFPATGCSFTRIPIHLVTFTYIHLPQMRIIKLVS